MFQNTSFHKDVARQPY